MDKQVTNQGRESRKREKREEERRWERREKKFALFRMDEWMFNGSHFLFQFWVIASSITFFLSSFFLLHLLTQCESMHFQSLIFSLPFRWRYSFFLSYLLFLSLCLILLPIFSSSLIRKQTKQISREWGERRKKREKRERGERRERGKEKRINCPLIINIHSLTCIWKC